MGNPEWTKEERFSDSLSRDKNQDELDQRVEEWTVKQNHYDLMHLLQGEGVPAGPVIFEDDAYTDPHLVPNKLRLSPVRLGEHNEYVYKQVLKVSDEEYAELEKEGHIGMDYVPEVP